MMRCIIFSNNQKKCNELQTLLHSTTIDVMGYKDVLPDTIDVVEDGLTFEENALKKLRALNSLTADICLADDSGLEVDCLDGQPGIYSARYGGHELTDSQRCDYLLENIKDSPQRSAQFRCVIAIKLPYGPELTFEGNCKGTITYQQQGDHGFGYDPIFVPKGFDQTFAQLGFDVKQTLSHRAKALQQAVMAIEKTIAL